MENLDLNSQQEDFPYIEEYSALLDRGRGRADGGRAASFQPPRQSASGIPIGRGRSAGRGSGRARGRSVSASHSPPAGASPPLRQSLRGRLSKFRGVRRGASMSGATHCPSFTNLVDDEDIDDEDVDSLPSNNYDKANWSAENTSIFCELCVEQMRLGNSPGGKINARGYKEIARKFNERTGLNHAPKQFRNRWTTCKKLYEFYKFVMSQSGLGRKANGAILASDEWWEENLKFFSSECQLFSRYMPDYVDDLQEMYQKVVVDGNSSTIAGNVVAEGIDLDNEVIDLPEDDVTLPDDAPEEYASPLSNSSRKRSSSTKDTAISPPKKGKNQFLNIFKGLVHTMKADSSEDSESIKLKQRDMELRLKQKEMEMKQREMEMKQREMEMKQRAMEMEYRRKNEEMAGYEVQECINKAIECGAAEGTEEFFVAIELFRDKYNRMVFSQMKSNEARFTWLHMNVTRDK
uniref:Myb/SANT-like domain-containing protein n=2 Tax=Setaria viridis TaxID=4556 RepID=A0A4U6T1K4_SETVI|nr:hypothetical protein SEVIR_9G303033v2 [Setaria viridis]